MAEFIRDNPPLDISDDHSGVAIASCLIDQILETGLEPTTPLRFCLPPINQDEIELLCWMDIEPKGESSANKERKYEILTLSNLEYSGFWKI